MGIMDFFNASKIKAENEELKRQIQQKETENLNLQNSLSEATTQIEKLGVKEYQETKAKLDAMEKECTEKLSTTNREVAKYNDAITSLKEEIIALHMQEEKLNKNITTQTNKISKYKQLYQSIEYAVSNFFDYSVDFSHCKLSQRDFEEFELISPSITLKLHCMDTKSLRKSFKENEKTIDKILDQYSARYTTKANKSIYSLMVIALRAELQNILYNLKYEKLDKSIDDVKTVCAKYLKIAGDGNQSIAGTLTKFIGEIEYLFINAVKIEYNYYVKKEQARQEQLAIKEQMRQEAEERKALEVERKKIEQEESKFNNQIATLSVQAESAEGTELEKLKSRILELQSQLANVVIKKDEITKLQNGKAGNVYIISNLGSFGENIFKIGMTRRLDPQDRVNELGDASVPFKFDVHSFIFSDEASDLETALHKRLNNCRVNKVNLRKEFFNVSIEKLEQLVNEICPTAEFNKTMLAEEFRQSQSTDEVYSSNFELDDLIDE